MDKLDHRQLTLIKRAAEDAIHACNRHYKPFIDVVAHPLNIVALVEMAQSRQAELDQLNEVLGERTKEWLEAIELGTYFLDIAKPLKDEVDQLQSQINEMAEVGLSLESELNKKDEYAHNLYYENANLQMLVEEKDKRITELEKACVSYKNQRDDNAQKLMVKSVHYNSIQEELAKLKDRLELAHHLATQSTWSSLKQLKKVVKALRGEHE